MKGVNAREISELLYKVFFFLENQKLLNSCTSISKKVEGGSFFPLPLPRHSFIHFFFFFRSCPSFLDEPREETLATQAKDNCAFFG